MLELFIGMCLAYSNQVVNNVNYGPEIKILDIEKDWVNIKYDTVVWRIGPVTEVVVINKEAKKLQKIKCTNK